MTVTEALPAPDDDISSSHRRWRYEGSGVSGVDRRAALEVAAVGLALVVAALWVTPGQGGRDPARMLAGSLSLVPALLVTRPWRYVPARELALAVAVVASTLVVSVTTPYGWAGGRTPATWAYGCLWYVVARAFAHTARRREAALVAVAVLGLDQFSRAWLPYWGSEDPATPMIGTFYWHNQLAIYLVACGGTAIAMILMAGNRIRALGWVCAPLVAVGVVLSTSRASMLSGSVVVALLAYQAGRTQAWRAVATRVVLLSVVSASLLFGMTSSLFFPNGSGTPFAGTARRSASEDFGTSGQRRLEFWAAAAQATADRPVLGAGFGSYTEAAAPYQPPGVVRSPAVHNGFLQAFAEGGAVHGVPVALAGAAACWLLLRRLRRPPPSGAADRWIAAGASAAGLVLIAHGAVDFDFFFPSLLALTGVVLAVAASAASDDVALDPGSGTPPDPDVAGLPPESPRLFRVLPGVLVVALVAAGGIAVAGGHASEVTTATLQRADALAATRGVDVAAEHVLARRDLPFRDPRVWMRVLEFSFYGNLRPGLLLDEDLVREAVARTERVAAVDSRLAMRRAQARYLLGEHVAGLAEAKRIVGQHARYRPLLVGMHADLLLRADRRADAAAVLVEGVAEFATPGQRAEEQVWGLVQRLLAIAPDSEVSACAYADAIAAIGEPREPLPKPMASCSRPPT
ncbi:MAG TPA: O-antigen ligase family protein [Mycobacteriales bacterium]|nr:O-antigen ligase family protein [Mycobacteriales bacterium]